MTHDLTFVAPERRAEVRRRIAVIERFIAAPGRTAAEACAAELGLRPAQFYNLVRAWRETARPKAIMGPGAPRKKPSRVDQRLLAVIDQTIAENGRAEPSTLIARVARVARARDIPMPNRTTLARQVLSRRPALLVERIRSSYDLVVDHTVLDLPVDFGAASAKRPLATIAIDVATDAIVGIAISPGAPRPPATARALLDAMRRGSRSVVASCGRPRVGIVAHLLAEVDAVLEPLAKSGFEPSWMAAGTHAGGLIIESLLGQQHADIRLRQRLVWHDGQRRMAALAPGANALPLEEAESLVRGRLLDDRATTVFAGLDETHRSRLEGDLMVIAQAG
ncbi:hypothetical protein [uncultured Sphingomonas sp.]|uniref:hypothetical protein n=1 Tax=uncultured Sphingomonas sp. TaxID=158754 RepID=UPI003747B72C